jgi:hypothetical protein
MLYILCTLFLFIACAKVNDKQKHKFAINEIDLSNAYSKSEKRNLSEIADSIIYIPLETDSSSIFGKINNPIENIQFANSRIFINDGDQLLSFSSDGKLINKIGRQGNGPEEYIRINDFALLENKRLIIIKSDAQQKLLIFTFDNEFIQSVMIDWWPSHISTLNNKYIVLANEKGQRKFIDYFTFSIIDSKGNLENHLLKQNWEEEIEKVDEVGLSNIANFYFHYDTLSYWEFQYDTIWRIYDKNKIIPRYHIKLGDNKLPTKFLLTSSARYQNKQSEFVRLYKYIESKRYMFFDIANKKQLLHVFYDKTTKKAINVKHGDTKNKFSFINDIDNGLPFWPEGIISNNKVFAIIYGIELNNKINKEQHTDKLLIENTRLKNLVQNSTIMDNPILMVVLLKDKK